MDPKALSHLDPKQREAYDRVMGTAAEVHGDTTTTPDINPPVNADGNDLSMSPTAPSIFDTPSTDLSSSPLPETTTTMQTSDLTTPAGEPDPSPSLFTDPSTATAEPTLEPAATQPSSSLPTSSFFTNNPIPEPTNADSLSTPELASPEAFPPVETPQDPTIASDNLSEVTPVTPYAPDDQGNTPDASMSQPFNTQPLPSPAEVNSAVPKEASPLIRVLYIVGAVVFFAIYTIFWVKVFNLPFIF